ARYADRGFAVAGLSIDDGPRAAKDVARMMKRRRATHPVFLDVEAAPAAEAYGVTFVPFQFLISPEGQIVAQWSGKIDLAVVEAEVRRGLGLEE
ncbi:MAG: TlpA disulfide reductase family protein, partial [Acidobacteriota bacterium]